MSDFTAIGQLVTEARNLLDSIKGGAIRTMQNSFDSAMSGFTNTFNSKLSGYQGQMNLATRPVMEVINGVEVYNVGEGKNYKIKHRVKNGGYLPGANIDPDFPNVANPKPPVYFNLLEFVANGDFGLNGDMFRVEFIQSHRGQITDFYYEHFVFTGISSDDGVSGFLEVKKVVRNNGMSLFISEPSGNQEIPITKEMEGQRIPITLRGIGQDVSAGFARLTLMQETNYHAGSNRDFYLDVEYTSSRGQPPVSLVNESPVSWSV